jgi:hypothetical protein
MISGIPIFLSPIPKNNICLEFGNPIREDIILSFVSSLIGWSDCRSVSQLVQSQFMHNWSLTIQLARRRDTSLPLQ